MRSPFRTILSAIVCLVLPLGLVAPASAQQALLDYSSIHHPVEDEKGMVVSQNELASRVGARVLAQGGNAVDAAVATALALAVTLPRAGNLGGGGFMMVYLADEQRTIAIDYRSAAPAAAEADMFLDRRGFVGDKADFGHRAAAVPGTVAGLALAHERYGSLPWATLVQPALELARDGIVVTRDLSTALQWGRARLESSDAAIASFFKADGSPYQFGERLVQSDLAWTMQRLAEAGPDDFYRGEIAARLVADMEANDGLITLADLGAYEAQIREPLRTTYRDFEVVTMPPASSGGVALLQMLNMLERFSLRTMGHNSAASIHTMSEVMKLAYADRRYNIGDPAFNDNPTATFTSKAYAAARVAGINRTRASTREEIGPADPFAFESPETTHFSVVDAAGNVVSNTYTLGSSFGSGVLVSGAGFLLDNQIQNFSLRFGVEGATYGNNEANRIEPGKRMNSSMTPTIVFKDGQPYLVVGSPGGSAIINIVLQVILNVVDHEMNIAEATLAPRIHQNWVPDELSIEPGFSPDTVNLLTQLGHEIELRDTIGSAQTIMLQDGLIMGAADPRRPGAAAIGVHNLEVEGD